MKTTIEKYSDGTARVEIRGPQSSNKTAILAWVNCIHANAETTRDLVNNAIARAHFPYGITGAGRARFTSARVIAHTFNHSGLFV